MDMSRFTSRMLASILAGLALLATAASAQTVTVLTLRPPVAHFKAESANGLHYRIENVQAGAGGGTVRVAYIGHEQCEGRVQHTEFKWTILPGISSLNLVDGQQAFTVYLTIDGDRDACMQVNPLYGVNNASDALWRAPGGEARFYQFEHPFHVPDPRVFTFNAGQLYRNDTGFSIDISLPSLPQRGGDQYSVEYRFDASSGGSREPDTVTYDRPTIDGMRVDRCLRWAEDCDQPAADAFCAANGHWKAESFAWEYTGPTRTLGDGLVCEDPSSCGAFSSIQCLKMPTK